MKHWLVILALALLSRTALAADDDAPQWIWGTDNATAKAPAGLCFLRVTFDLQNPESGRIEISCDDTYGLFVNDERVGAGTSWEQLDTYDLLPYLRKGKNAIAVLAENASEGPAGLMAKVTVKSKRADPISVSTGKKWKTSLKIADGWRKPEFDDANWESARALGAFGKTAPWGDRVKPAATTPLPVEFVAKERPAGPFQLLDGDRVAFIGDTLIERAQASDYIEALMTARYPDRNILFRNLGWSGDTVFGDARAGFGTAADGFQQLRQQAYGFKPTVIFVGYGGNSSFEGDAGLPRFRAGLGKLLEMLEVTKAKIVLLSPIRHEDLGSPLPNPDRHNQDLARYTAVIYDVAKERGHLLINLFERLGQRTKTDLDVPLTDNGIHLTAYGYWRAARKIEDELHWPQDRWIVSLKADGQIDEIAGTKLSALKVAGKSLTFKLLDDRLPVPAAPQFNDGRRLVRVHGLPAGKHALRIDGRDVLTATSDDWSAGQTFRAGAEFDQVEKLRKTIIAKNRLYFYRWRPQNETYLFGFRKHEQGRNAKEVPLFDPLVTAEEKKIADLRVPVEHTYEISPAK